MKQLTVIAVAFFTISASAAAQETREGRRGTRDEDAVLAASQKTTEAVRHNDADELGEMLADDYYFVSARGKVLDKRAQLTAFRDGTTHFDALTTSDERVRMFKDVAVVTNIRHQKARSLAGPSADDVRVIQVYERRHGRWLLVVSQQTNIQP